MTYWWFTPNEIEAYLLPFCLKLNANSFLAGSEYIMVGLGVFFLICGLSGVKSVQQSESVLALCAS